MEAKKLGKKIAVLASPLLLFALLVVPYSRFNSQFVVEWFGCGCPKIDIETGQMIESAFNANSFTRLFWLFVALCATVAAGFLSRRMGRGRRWLRVAYVTAMCAVSVGLSYLLSQMMMWN